MFCKRLFPIIFCIQLFAGGTAQAAPLGAELDQLFYQALHFVDQSDYQNAGKQFLALGHAAQNSGEGEVGYTNLPDYSLKLLERARSLGNEDQKAESVFLIKRAIELSPTEGKIYLIAASFYSQLGRNDILNYLFSGLRLLAHNPSVLVPLALNGVLVVLVAFTVAMMLVCLVQFACYGEVVLTGVGRSLPLALRGVGGPIGFFLVLFLPPLGGILFALICWTVLLKRNVAHCRRLCGACIILALAWAAVLPTMIKTKARVNTDLVRVLENGINGSFIPSDGEVFLEPAGSSQENVLMLYARAHYLMRQGLTAEAEKAFARVVKLTNEGSALALSSLINVAALKLLRDQNEESKLILLEAEKRGEKSFELYFNLAQAHLALIDTEGHRAAYAKAGEIDKERLTAIESGIFTGGPVTGTSKKRILSSVLSLPALYREIFSDRFPNIVEVAGSAESAKQVAGSLILFGSPQVLALIALLALFFGSVKATVVGRSEYLLSTANEPSFIWLLMPAGLYVAGKKPLRGFMVLGSFLALVMAASGKPLPVFEIFPTPLAVEDLFIYAAVFLFVGAMLFSSFSVRTVSYGRA